MRSYSSSECLVRMNYHLNGNINVVTAGFFHAYAACPLKKTTDWRMNKFTREFMVEFFFQGLAFLCPRGRTNSNIIIAFTPLRHTLSSIHRFFCSAIFLVTHLLFSNGVKEFGVYLFSFLQ